MRMRTRSTAGGSRFDSCATLHNHKGGDPTDNRYKDPRKTCAWCGKPLPPGRKKVCFECLRPWGRNKPSDAPLPKPRYTWQEQAARAEARNISYGRLVYLEEQGLSLPPLVRSVRWPWDSPHQGEEQI